MDNKQKSLKSPLSAKCTECGDPCREGNKYCGKVACRVQAHFRRKIEAPIKAEAAGGAQKSIAKHILPGIEYALIQATDSLEQLANVEQKLNHLKTFLKEFLKKPE